MSSDNEPNDDHASSGVGSLASAVHGPTAYFVESDMDSTHIRRHLPVDGITQEILALHFPFEAESIGLMYRKRVFPHLYWHADFDGAGSWIGLEPDMTYFVLGDRTSVLSPVHPRHEVDLSELQAAQLRFYLEQMDEIALYNQYGTYRYEGMIKEEKRVVRQRAAMFRLDTAAGTLTYFRTLGDGKQISKQVFLGAQEFKDTFHVLHSDPNFGQHGKVDCTWQKINAGFYCHHLYGLSKSLVRACTFCGLQRIKLPVVLLQPILTDAPNQMMDYTKFGRYWILAVKDHFTAMMWHVAFFTKSSKNVCDLVEKLIREKGRPLVVLMDNGGEFIADALRALLDGEGVEWRHGTPYKPSTQGSIERSHVTTKQKVYAQMHEIPEFQNLYAHRGVDKNLQLEQLNHMLWWGDDAFAHERHSIHGVTPYE
ncbi:hypothetical protein HKX48_002331, partial [Thoreauomyces humboldtii]